MTQSPQDKPMAPAVPTISSARHWFFEGLVALGNLRLAAPLLVPMILLDRLASLSTPSQFTQPLYLIASATCLQTFFAWSRYFEVDRSWSLVKRLRIFPYVRLAPACVPIAISSMLVSAGLLLLPDRYQAWLPAVVWTLVSAEQLAPFFSIRAALLDPTDSHLVRLFRRSDSASSCAPLPLIAQRFITWTLVVASTYLYFFVSPALGTIALAATSVIAIASAVAAVHDYEPFISEDCR